jgi:hypothetical protein
MAKQIKLTQDKYATVDDEDYDVLNKWKWCADKSTYTTYAVRRIESGSTIKKIYMHREIMGDVDRVDHVDRDGLNNQRNNLRACNASTNSQNMMRTKPSVTGYKGVHLDKRDGVYQVEIWLNNKRFYLGRFRDAIDAARAYDAKARELFGEFARPNFPLPKSP